MEAFLTVSNLLDERAPLSPSNSGLPGLFYPTLGFYDDMGRYLHRRRQGQVLIVDSITGGTDNEDTSTRSRGGTGLL